MSQKEQVDDISAGQLWSQRCEVVASDTHDRSVHEPHCGSHCRSPYLGHPLSPFSSSSFPRWGRRSVLEFRE
eukprot:4356822-Pyramimonas_sp.AAC.1